MKSKRALLHGFAIAGVAVFLAGCHTDMWRQPKVGAQDDTPFFKDGQADRPRIEGTVAYGGLKDDELKYRGRIAGKLSTTLPPTLTINGEELSTTKDLEKIIRRGKERFTIFCSHCHGASGDGQGMIAKRGLTLRRPPATYHTDRLRKMPIGHFYDVMSNGFGVMYTMKSKVEPDDRWAIATYIRVLQAASNAKESDIPAEQLESIKNPSAAKKEGSHSDAH